MTAPERPVGRPDVDLADLGSGAPRAALAKAIPRRPSVSWWLGVIIAIGFALCVVPSITADRWLDPHVVAGEPAGLSVRVPPFAGAQSVAQGGGIVIERGALASDAEEQFVAHRPGGSTPYLAFLLLTGVLGAIFTHHMRRSNRGRLVRVQLVSLALIVAAAAIVKVVLLLTTASVLIVPVAVFAMAPTMALDRIVGLATGILAALIFTFVGPFDLSVACLFLVQASVAGLVVAERPKRGVRAAVLAGGAATLCTVVTYPLLVLLTQGHLPAAELGDILHSPWYAATIGPLVATLIAVPMIPVYQLLVGEITQGTLVELEDLSHPLLRQIAEKSPGTWQHSLAMANMAEIAANAIGASGRLVRVGAYFHDLGKSLAPKYFIENLEAGETSPHDQLPPEVSCDAIFAHVTEGIVAARRAGLHERIVDFMHMHHGNGVLEYFWGKTREQGNPKKLTIEQFRYPGFPPQSRETAILAICDAVEAASRTLKKPDAAAIDSLVQRIVYGKLHLGQLDESGLSMSDLRRIADSLRETIRHANHGRIEYPWQKQQQADAANPKPVSDVVVATGPRLDSLDRAPAQEPIAKVASEPADPIEPAESGQSGKKLAHTGPEALAATADLHKAAPATLAETQSVRPRRRSSSQSLVDPVASTDAIARPAPPEYERAEVIELDTPQAPLELHPSEMIDLVPSARKRAATLPPTQSRRSPTIPPTMTVPRKAPPGIGPAARGGRPDSRRPEPKVDLENAITNPPRTKAPTGNRESVRVKEWSDTPISVKPTPDIQTLEMPLDALEALAGEAGRTHPTMPTMSPFDDPPQQDATRPRLILPLTAPASNPGIKLPTKMWSAGLAARIDAAVDDDFGGETPVVAPTRAELRSLLGTPDPTRQQSIDEIEANVSRSARERERIEDAEPEFLRRRVHPTAEVDPDDIESAIELAPPARRPTAIGVAKKKPE